MDTRIQSIDRIETQDEYPDASYLYQEGSGFEDRRAAYEAGEFYFVGIQARAEILIPHGSDYIVETITSPGLWGIESDSGEAYFNEVFRDEETILREMLDQLGVIEFSAKRVP